MKDLNHVCRGLISPILSVLMLLVASVPLAAGTGSGEEPPEGGISAWANEVANSVQAIEYHLSWQPPGAVLGVEAGYTAPNRAQNLRFAFQDDGVWATSRIDPTWVFGLRPSRVSVGSRSQSLIGNAPVASDNEAVYHLAGATQTMSNRPNGLDYLLRVDVAPGEGRTMRVAFGISGDVGIRLRRPDAVDIEYLGDTVVRFGPFVASDTLGAKLPVTFERGESGEIEVAVSVYDAVYPVTLEAPLKSISTTAGFFMNDSIPYSRLGWSAATAGDVNGDGYSDVIVGFPNFDGTAGMECGMVRLYHGGPFGPGTPASANWTAQGSTARAKFGSSVATAGDVNGDGYSDVIVGAPMHDINATDNHEGSVWVYHGSGSGVNSTPAWYRFGDQPGANRGACVATAGDVNGDGYSDIVFSEPGYDYTLTNRGRVFVYQGGSSGLSGSSVFYPMGDQANAHFGESVATAGDVNGDGYADIVIAAPWSNHSGYTAAGEVRVYYGSSGGPDTGTFTSITQNAHNLRLGLQASTAGDVNGDGYADLIVGSAKTVNNEGAAFLYLGDGSGINTFYIWSAEGSVSGDEFGQSVATAGDVNGDGYADIIVGASSLNSTGRGRAFVWLGSGLGTNGTPANAYWTGVGDPTDGHLYGLTVAAAGDVNGDGYSDILVADPDYGAENNGALYGYFGGPDNLSDTPAWTHDGNQQGAQAGVSVATAGDVNGDGYADFIVGAEFYDYTYSNEGAAFVWYGDAAGPGWAGPDWSVYGGRDDARLGHSVGTAGDVDGDGYSDVIVGAPDWSNGTYHEGGAFVFTGGPSGINGTSTANAAWKAEIGDYEAQFGWSVATAGDVNDDGYADVVVGAPGAGPTYQGKAFLWFGGATGLGADGTLGNADWNWIGSTAYGLFGQSVGTAGDVNRDAFSDVVVGGDEVAVVWHGSSNGLSSSTFNWSYASSGFDDNDLGASVGTAGDVNGDGYSDVVVGAPMTDGDIFTADDGAVLVFCGSASGLGGGPCFTDYGGVDGMNLGSSVATAGDINGDGLSDVVAGARHLSNGSNWEGGARVYLGTIFGLFGSDWSFESGQTNAFLGHAVGTAGDVNGDGFADLLLGAPGSASSFSGEGRVYLFFGNDETGGGTGGRARRTQQLSPTNLPIAPLGRSSSENAIRLYHRLPAPATGRGDVRYQSEVKAFGTSFNGQSLTTTSTFDSGTNGYAVNQNIDWLVAGNRYHWRTRVLHSAVTNPFDPPRGPWFHMTCFAENEAHLRTAGGGAPPQDLIFSDGFESGGFGNWSSNTP